jgi:hypothetical protein
MIKPMSCAIVLLSLGIACKHQEPNFCANQLPDHNCMEFDAPAVGGSDAGQCTTDPQCSGGTPVCDTVSSMCVQCTAGKPTACTGTTPVCGSDDTCQACTAHSQCAADVCLPDGSCDGGSDVAYVSPTGSGTACTHAMPCATVADGLATNRPYVKLSGTIDEQVSVASQNVTMLADPGAILTSSSNGVILTVTGSSQLTIYDLEINGASGTMTGIGISIPVATTSSVTLTRAKVTASQYIGISASSGTLTVAQSTISQNTAIGLSASGGTVTIARSTIAHNDGGGVSITSSQFDLTNNMIANNGGNSSSFGGVLISQSNTGTRNLAFNTVANNSDGAGDITGVTCAVIGTAVTFSDNIVFGNQVSGAGTQVGGAMCSWTYSDISDSGGSAGSVAGTGNIDLDPMFVNSATGNYHISAGSPCIDAADPAATLDIDFDGDVRPIGSGRDIGADEYHP